MPLAARRFTAVAALLLLAITTIAQPAPFTAGETIDVSIINVDVVVTDRNGNRVRGLTRDDFQIYENGRPQQLSNFAEYIGGDHRVGVEGLRADAPAEEAAPRQPRNLLIFIERMRLPNFAAEPMIDEIRSVVKRTIGPGDAASIVVWSRHGGTEHVELTGDLDKIDATLVRLRRELQHAHIDHTAMLREEALKVRQFERGAESLPSAQPGGGVTLAMLVAYGEMKVRVNAINSAINTMAGVDGKKVMLLAARRLGHVAGAEYAYAAGLNPIPYDLRQRYGTDSLIGSISDMANASGVTIYPLYPIGLGTAMPDASTDFPQTEMDAYLTFQNETSAHAQIAQRTGGLSARSAKDVIELLPRIGDDMTDYYSLAYRVTPSGKDVARDIVVKTKNPELRVRARRQFVEKSDETRMRDRLRATFFRAEEESQIDIDATIGGKNRRGRSTLPLSVRIPIAALTTLPQGGGKHAGSFSVYVGAASDIDELSDITRKTQPFEINESQLAAAREGYFTYDLDVTVNPKAKYVAVGVLDEVGRTYGVLRLPLEQAR